jgi:hypothetical protein
VIREVVRVVLFPGLEGREGGREGEVSRDGIIT